jgi:hypothetical protein
MKRGRIALLCTLLLAAASTAAAQEECDPDQILATSNADTIFVQHLNAYKNCCLELVVDVEVDGFIVDFYESDIGEPCDCMCCFHLAYDADGFAAGHYTVRVWTGNHLYGEAEVDVEGPGSIPRIGSVESGPCSEPAAVTEPVLTNLSWGRIRTGYR